MFCTSAGGVAGRRPGGRRRQRGREEGSREKGGQVEVTLGTRGRRRMRPSVLMFSCSHVPTLPHGHPVCSWGVGQVRADPVRTACWGRHVWVHGRKKNGQVISPRILPCTVRTYRRGKTDSGDGDSVQGKRAQGCLDDGGGTVLTYRPAFILV